ncbi:type I 3-dehydroquinate dehydratase [Treponema sp.]|uniref:type I 3-dehydroquinate dehydratase n=1 Tax=Treponema sp. TaxID=166 RepID=UPI00298DF243|nr:type I 3-dehydroquinate dehydratase [Treponema sp.]MCR5613508.1 type I 3-dehydroquinate dehydratase [Treponema sp.]
MSRPLICLSLTCTTIQENLKLIEQYRPYIDLVELRADYLDEDECLHIRQFPRLADIPCILTIRRRIDGGQYFGGEAARTMLFARAMAFADQNPKNNFTYVDFEDDFHIPSLQDAAQAFGTRIIRSFHDMKNPVNDIIERCDAMRKTGFEIPKIAFQPHSLKDVTHLFEATKNFTQYDHILCAMGELGTPSRILAYKTHSYLTYCSPKETAANTNAIGHLDPITLNSIYHFKDLSEATKIYGITGYPLPFTSSPELHNRGYIKNNLNAVYVPIRSPKIADVLEFCDSVGVEGLSVTIPHKETVLAEIDDIDEKVAEIRASNTLVKKNGRWVGYNTDASGFAKALKDFLGVEKLKRRRVAIIGAGGAARAVAYAVKMLGGRACIFNRTVSNAKMIADRFGFAYAQLGPDALYDLELYSDIIIQTTSVGAGFYGPSSEKNDPIYFYNFTGNEHIYDIIYSPEITPMMARASAAGCKVSNGYSMLKNQGYEQFKLFTGVDYGTESE